MAKQTLFLVRDNSTLVNFKAWAKPISDWFTSCGWTRSSDSGQVNWSTIASVPAVNTFVYEIWQPGDALTTFFLKVEYGTNSGSANTSPSVRFTVGSATNGSGTLTGLFSSQMTWPGGNSSNVTSTSTQWACHFTGDSGRIGFMYWRDELGNAANWFAAVQRSKNSSGVDTSVHVTLVGSGNGSGGNGHQQSVVFGVAVAPAYANNVTNASRGMAAIANSYLSSSLFNGSIAIDPVRPWIGKFDNPMDICGVGNLIDFTEGCTYTVPAGNMPYGTAHDYIASKNLNFANCDATANGKAVLLMRYD